MTPRQLISSGSSFEQSAGYSRAVVQGDWMFVSGTTGYDYEKMILPEDFDAQAEACFRTIEKVLKEGGFGLHHVVRVHYLIPDRIYAAALFAISGRYFGAIRPAATLMIVGLLEEAMKIEIEVTAFRG